VRNDSIVLRPIRLGEIQLSSRIIMASMTRARTENAGLVPIPLQAQYYGQRHSALIAPISATIPWPNAWPN
jgi:N-ethylmaleimide reductase